MCNVLCFAVDYQYILYVAMETVRFLHTPNEIFLSNNFILIKSLSVTYKHFTGAQGRPR